MNLLQYWSEKLHHINNGSVAFKAVIIWVKVDRRNFMDRNLPKCNTKPLNIYFAQLSNYPENTVSIQILDKKNHLVCKNNFLIVNEKQHKSRVLVWSIIKNCVFLVLVSNNFLSMFCFTFYWQNNFIAYTSKL